ncbi:MAG: succinylglutamate desuccinylase/aspartoacylase family protein [Candidatus Sedimenticola endophacoides]
MAKADVDSRALTIGGIEIAPGQTRSLNLPLAMLYIHAPVEMPVHVINGLRSGPRLFITAALHGDELNGIEIIRRLLNTRMMKRLRGCLVAVPIVNVFGVLNQSRYLPDRRDLNRCFPGTEKGSLAARVADLLMSEIVSQCTHGIDIHTGALHRNNLPQIRAAMDDPVTATLATAFGTPVVLNSNLRDGSLRQAAAELGIPTLLYESGEALRFDETCIRVGVQGILNVMRTLEMLPPAKRSRGVKEPVVIRSSTWVRAPIGGIVRTHIRLGEQVETEQQLATISDPFGNTETQVTSPGQGIIIGRSNLPLVNEGEALFHVARFCRKSDARQVTEAVGELEVIDSLLPPMESEIR